MIPPVLTTRRLTLRPVTLDDADAIVRGLSNWDVVQWLTAPPFPYAKTDAEYFITQINPKIMNWAIDAGDGLIGLIGVKPDLGFWLDVEYHGQHIVSEAAQAVAAWYFESETAPLISGHYMKNVASRRVLQKLGFVDTDTEEQLHTATQEPVTVQRVMLTKSAWNTATA